MVIAGCQYNCSPACFCVPHSSIMQIPGESTLKRNFQQIQEREGRVTPNPLYQPPAPPRGAQNQQQPRIHPAQQAQQSPNERRHDRERDRDRGEYLSLHIKFVPLQNGAECLLELTLFDSRVKSFKICIRGVDSYDD